MKRTITIFILVILTSCSDSGAEENSSNEEIVKVAKPWVVEIFAEQFKWTARYSGEDNVLGKFDYKLMNESNPLGLMTANSIDVALQETESELNRMDSMALVLEATGEFLQEHNKCRSIFRLLNQMKEKHDKRIDVSALNDLIITDTLVLCVDKEYEFAFRSKDVIHSAYFPHFRAQMNTVPGMTSRLKFTPTETSKERKLKEKDSSFEFILMCNKICGAGHYSMKMIVRVVDIEEYHEWLISKRGHLFANGLTEQ